MNIGLFYNADMRNNGTARRLWDAYVRDGGKEAGGKRYSRPMRACDKHDLYLFVDDGREDLPMTVPKEGHRACWLIDTHLGWDTRRAWADNFDTVFCAQKPAADRMRDEGVNAHWLPLACHSHVDPSRVEFQLEPSLQDVVGKLGLEKRYDTVFVGHTPLKLVEGQHDRVGFLDRVFAAYPNSWYAGGVFFEQAALRYIRGRVGLNYSILDDLNMRFFEIPSYGTCMLANRDAVGWDELGFVEGEHFVGYDTVDEAIAQIQGLLDDPCKRERIARHGKSLVRGQHTYTNRIETIREICEL